jgi:hypothetical protein
MDDPNEIGVGITETAPVGAEYPCSGEMVPCAGTGGPDGELWYLHRFSKRFSFGGTIFGGRTSIVGAGAQVRFHWADLDRFQVGTDIDAGFLYFQLGVPISVRLVDRLWLYSEPQFGYRTIQPLRVPLGLTYGFTDLFWLSIEGSYGFDFLTEPVNVAGSDYWNAGLSGSFRF